MTAPRPLDRRRFILAAAAGLLAACSGRTDEATTAEPSVTDAAAPSPSPSPTASPTASPTPVPSVPSAPVDVAAAVSTPEGLEFPTGIVPTRVQISAIDVDASCVEVNITAQEVEVPDFGLAGWWVQTRKPGEIGPAVIGGHVDTKAGPDVFFRLKDLRAGDDVTVTDDNGEERSFVVTDDPIQVRKDQRPPEVFGFTNARPELRLITCGGEFNPNIGHYVDNIVVFCHDPSFEA